MTGVQTCALPILLGAILGVLFAVIGRWVLSKDDALVEYIDREQ